MRKRLPLVVLILLIAIIVVSASLFLWRNREAEMSLQALVESAYVVALDGDDAQAGTVEAPFRTINRALRALKPGDTLLVRGGQYAESLNNTIPSGESWERPVTLKAYPGEQVIIMPPPGAERVINFAGDSQYIIVDGFILDGTHTQYEVIKLSGKEDSSEPSPSHIRIMNNEIRNAGAAQSSNGEYRYFSAGILATGQSNYIEYLHNIIHDNGVTDFDHGLYHTSSFSIIDGNHIYNNKGSGIKIGWGQNARDNIVRNNIVYNNNTAEGDDGQKDQGRGIGVYAGTGTLVYNNIVWGHHHSAIDVTYGGNDARIINNTIHNTTGWGIVIGFGADGTETAQNTLVANNIVYQQSDLPAIMDARGVDTVIENNLTFGLDPHIDKDADTNTVIQNNLEGVDPLFVDADNFDFELQGNSPAINAGLTLDMVALDFNHQARPAGEYDIGAYEYTQSFFLLSWLKP
ncbi:MAG: right-handed parallel beta-helix repeat-containing protein [Anaerolineae bacterium]|nr:right-handed parallel beta-helix repeat-containing protein [Anaerolineae bacterium]